MGEVDRLRAALAEAADLCDFVLRMRSRPGFAPPAAPAP